MEGIPMPEVRDHGDEIYRTRQPDEVSWYRAHLTLSLQLIEQSAPDRAVFHFLTEPQDRGAHVTQVLRAVSPHGHVIIATFGPEGPLKCSGLDVVRYDADALHDAFGPRVRRVRQLTESHRTPTEAVQQYVYCQFERLGEAPH